MSGFPPPPGQGFPPPPGQQQPSNNKFPPPNQGGFPPPPAAAQPQQPGAGFAPPPAPTTQLNQAMGNMSIQANQPPQPGTSFAPPPPAASSGHPGPPAAPKGPAMFTPGPPPPGANGGAPQMMQPPAPMAAAPQMMQPPAGQFGHQPPPLGQFQPPAPQQPHAQLNQQGAASPFYGQQPSAQQMQRAVAPGASSAPGGMPAPFQENIDYSIQIPERLCLFTAKKIPQTAGMATSSKVPIGGILRPLAPAACEEDEVDVVQPGNAGIIRCKRCRTYINAFVTWLENGRRWRCNICAQLNDCPSTYFCHLDEQGHRRDRLQRPELSKGVVEFVAPTEYMVRPPQEPAYFFVLDVSATAVRSGMLHSAASAIRQSLDDLPGRGRTKVGFITYDNSVHYYNLAPDLSSPQMMVVSDLKELFVPLPEHLLVNLKESRGVVEAFLDNLPEMFAKNPVVSQSCLGPALKAAFTVVKSIGGKMSVFQTIQPNLGDGSLKPRENNALMGTPNEVKLLRPDVPWYKDTAVEFSRQQISVDMYLFPYQYMDLAALGELPRYTAGNLYSYASFNHEKDGPRFEAELHKSLTQTTAFEAVMRIRCTKGMRITNFYGNFYIRGTDLLALPNCNTDSVFGFDIAHDEQNMPSSVVTVQAALLYTSSDGERRIRVMTQALPVTSLASELMASVDTDSVCNLLSKQALELCNKTTLDNARMRLQQTCVDMMRAAKGGDKRTVSGYTVPPGPQGQADGDEKPIPENLALLPLNTLALMKNVAFRGGTDVHPDERTQAQHLLNNMWVEKSRYFIYPRMFSIHNMEDAAGLPSESNPDNESDDHFAGRENILLPESVNLSVERLTSDGIFLLDNGVEMNLWVGRSADPILLQALFGTNSLENVDPSHITLHTSGDDFATRLGSIMQALREDDADPFVVSPKVNIIREGDAHREARFFWFLVEDRASFQGGTYSYSEFMEFVKNPSGPNRAPPGPGPPGMGRSGPPGPPHQMPGSGGPPPPPGPGGMPRGMAPQHGMAPPPPGSAPQQQHAPPPPGGQYGMPAPPPMHQGPPSGGPPMQQGPPSGGPPMQQGPPSGGPPMQQGPPSGGYGAPPARPPVPPQQQYGMPPPPGPVQQGPPSAGSYGQPPPGPPGAVQQGPPSGGYGAPPPPPRQSGAHPPPMPPPPPQYR